MSIIIPLWGHFKGLYSIPFMDIPQFIEFIFFCQTFKLFQISGYYKQGFSALATLHVRHFYFHSWSFPYEKFSSLGLSDSKYSSRKF